MKGALSILVLMLAVQFGFGLDNSESQKQSLNQQYQALSSTCETLDGFRMMKLYKMDQFWKVVQDSLRDQRATVIAAKSAIEEKANEIAVLKSSLSSSKEQVAKLETVVDSLNIFGREYDKGSFVFFVATIVVLLTVLSIILFIISRSAYTSYQEERSLHEAIFTEFENYKHAAIEKQMKLCRELQDYRNRSNEIKKSA
jgi:biopolymer transport protein ExbB/TolQ